MAEDEIDRFVERVRARDPEQKEFLQAVSEVVESVYPLIRDNAAYRDADVLSRMVEPERVVSFRVVWEDDDGDVQVNRATRVQFNGAIGPYKGGMRFDPGVTLSTLKFLGFEQTFKNALTGLPMGGGKGGADFDPKGRSDREVMRFCQALMTELYQHIDMDVDIPAGDMGVGEREIGYLFGQFRRVTGRYTGVLTGKGEDYGGSAGRTEATGYGLLYFVREMLERRDEVIEGKRVAISGSGNVALYAAEKAIELGAKVIALSDSDGTAHDPDGLDSEKFEKLRTIKEEERGRISAFADSFASVEYLEGRTPWALECDVALPCATQNEIDGESARTLTDNGLLVLAEGANMPCTTDAVDILRRSDAAYAPGKATNAGGVAVSGLELTQNAERRSWNRETVDRHLTRIMRDIHDRCVRDGELDDGGIDYVCGANRAAFRKVADAMLAQGLI